MCARAHIFDKSIAFHVAFGYNYMETKKVRRVHMPTSKQIADLAGVSRGTVDRVLKNRGVVNPKTAARVQKIAYELGYRPNRVAQALVSKQKNITIGIVLFGQENRFFDDVITGIKKQEAQLADNGCKVRLTSCRLAGVDSQIAAIDEMVKEGIYGLVLSPIDDPAIAAKIDALYENNIPVITTNTDIHGTKRIAYVGSDYEVSGKTAGALMKILTAGKAKVGIITGYTNVQCHVDRVFGFKEKLLEDAPDIEVVACAENHDDDFESYTVTQTMLKEHPEISALYISAGGVYGACRTVLDMGLGEKIKILTHDDIPTTKALVRDGIIDATICQEPEKQGSLPVSMMYDYLTYGMAPKVKHNYTDIIIRIKENLL